MSAYINEVAIDTGFIRSEKASEMADNGDSATGHDRPSAGRHRNTWASESSTGKDPSRFSTQKIEEVV